jgi:hypothetical protein
MEICVLKFDGSRGADDALAEVMEADGAKNPWLLDVGVIARPLVGRVRVALSFPDGVSKTFHEGDVAEAAADAGGLSGYYLSALAGPFGPMFGAVDAAVEAGERGQQLEENLFHVEELKRVLPRDSSALVFLGDTETCDGFVEMFELYEPQVIRHYASEELLRRLQAIHERMAQERSVPAGAVSP